MNRVRLNTSIDPDILKKLRVYAAVNGKCMNEVIEKAIIFYLEYEKKAQGLNPSRRS